MKITNTKSGPGGAHIGFSMFGARGPLREGEDTGGGAAAPVVPAATATAPVETGTAPGAASEKMLPQSQVNDLVAKARAEGRERALKEARDAAALPLPPAAKTPAPKSDQVSLSHDDVQAIVQRERVFTRVTATAGLNDRQLARMEAAFAAEKPADVAAWSTAYIEDMGIVKQPVTTQPAPAQITTPAAPAAEVKPAPAAPSAPSGSVDPTTSGGLLDIFRLTEPQLAQLGPKGLREQFEKIVSVGQQQLGAPPRPQIAAARK